MSNAYQRAVNIQNIKTKKKVKDTTTKVVENVKPVVKKVVKNVKPVVSSAIDKGKSNIKKLKINQNVSNVVKNKNVKGLRLLGTRLKNQFINTARPPGKVPFTKGLLGFGPGKGIIKKTPLLGAILAHGDYKDEKKRLVALGYTSDRAAKIAFIRTASEFGGYAAGGKAGGFLGAVGAGTLGSVIPVAGTAAGATAGGIGGTVVGGWAGGKIGTDLVAPLLIRSLGLKKSKEQLDRQLAIRQQNNNKLEEMNAQVGGAN